MVASAPGGDRPSEGEEAPPSGAASGAGPPRRSWSALGPGAHNARAAARADGGSRGREERPERLPRPRAGSKAEDETDQVQRCSWHSRGPDPEERPTRPRQPQPGCNAEAPQAGIGRMQAPVPEGFVQPCAHSRRPPHAASGSTQEKGDPPKKIGLGTAEGSSTEVKGARASSLSSATRSRRHSPLVGPTRSGSRPGSRSRRRRSATAGSQGQEHTPFAFTGRELCASSASTSTVLPTPPLAPCSREASVTPPPHSASSAEAETPSAAPPAPPWGRPRADSRREAAVSPSPMVHQLPPKAPARSVAAAAAAPPRVAEAQRLEAPLLEASRLEPPCTAFSRATTDPACVHWRSSRSSWDNASSALWETKDIEMGSIQLGSIQQTWERERLEPGSPAEAGEEYEVCVHVHSSEALGLELKSTLAGVLVRAVGPGAVNDWNAAHPEATVSPGDTILMVNGIHGFQMMHELTIGGCLSPLPAAPAGGPAAGRRGGVAGLAARTLALRLRRAVDVGPRAAARPRKQINYEYYIDQCGGGITEELAADADDVNRARVRRFRRHRRCWGCAVRCCCPFRRLQRVGCLGRFCCSRRMFREGFEMQSTVIATLAFLSAQLAENFPGCWTLLKMFKSGRNDGKTLDRIELEEKAPEPHRWPESNYVRNFGVDPPDCCDSRIPMREVMLLAAHFSHFATAAYGRAILLFMGYWASWCLLSSRGVFARMGRLLAKDVLHFKYRAKPYRPIWYLCIDRATRSVVVSIRGTCSFDDILSDLTARYVVFRGYGMHEGFLASARCLRSELLFRLQILPELRYEGYHLVVTGHSLGGAVAALLTWILREEDHFAALCFTFGAPPAVDPRLAREMQGFVIGIIHNNDLVPSLEFQTVLEFRDQAQPMHVPLRKAAADVEGRPAEEPRERLAIAGWPLHVRRWRLNGCLARASDLKPMVDRQSVKHFLLTVWTPSVEYFQRLRPVRQMYTDHYPPSYISVCVSLARRLQCIPGTPWRRLHSHLECRGLKEALLEVAAWLEPPGEPGAAELALGVVD